MMRRNIPAVSLDPRLDGVLLHSLSPCVTFASALIVPGLGDGGSYMRLLSICFNERTYLLHLPLELPACAKELARSGGLNRLKVGFQTFPALFYQKHPPG